ncbi:acyltransferase [Haloarcula argentinensis]|uniref:Acyltransferase n=1 Tax=Haloarcula argentinensis TaxID=43776 RepID=A0A847UMA7_HALAR|nr:acyltransferase [Haloarcula argentinensis]NLV12904.1 acyltransferase [Haloarcula argentinensis]
MAVHETAQIENATLDTVEIREFVTIHDAEIGDGVQIYEGTSIKKATIHGPTDINANVYVENATVGESVQIGPNASIVGVTHDLSETGMEFQNDTFDEIIIENGAFVGAGAVVLPGVTVGENAVVGAGTTVTEDVPPETVVRSATETVQHSL